MPVSSGAPAALRIDVVSDVVCPWCFIGKPRLENALTLVPDIPVDIHLAAVFPQSLESRAKASTGRLIWRPNSVRPSAMP